MRFAKIICSCMLAIEAGALAFSPAGAQQSWQQKEFFENSESVHAHFYSEGNVSAPSALELIDGKLPVDTSSFVSAPNSLRLSWTSAPEGEWDVELRLPNWPNRYLKFTGDTLSLWLYSKDLIQGSELPRICLHDAGNGFSQKVRLGDYADQLAAGRWTRLLIPISAFRSRSVRPFEPARTNTIIFLQGDADSHPHTVLIDNIRIESVNRHEKTLPVPANVHAKGYERHVLLTWDASDDPDIAEFIIYRSMNGGPFVQVQTQRPDIHRAVDFINQVGVSASYRVTARTSGLRESASSSTIEASTHTMTDDELLTMVQEASFSYYWDGAEPHSGLARESIPGDPDMIAVGGSGFGIMSLIVGAQRGFAPREAIVDRMLRITNYLAHADRFHGAWPHFLSGSTGHILPAFGVYDDGADIVETSFLMEGLLSARGYFTRDTPKERQLRDEITALWRGVEWDWFNATPQRDALYWHWSPDFGFHKKNRLGGWNETLMPYLLGIASPTHPLAPSLYYSGWCSEGNPARHFGKHSSWYGITLTVADPNGTTGPLFFTDYSFMGYDPRGVRDKYANYFVNNRNMGIIQQKYATDNPRHFAGYGADDWGMSAVTGPHGYRAFHPPSTDDGTLAPTAAMGAYAYTPQASLLALKHFYRDLGPALWDVYGFRNAFNQSEDWYATGELALNQGPQAVMIENGRTGLVWRSFMSNPEMPAMQKKIGLVPDKDQ
ncbi:MAG TPA: glucoamylase family protein [Bryocella sp.]|nr:glucoamylase family protein [Bryocella sp.]